MRGKVVYRFRPESAVGITPAYAGKRGHGKHRPHAGRDHPRVCGEKLKFSCPLVIVEGSPPRMRGKVGQGRQNNLFPGITPAYAGKSCFTDVTSHRSGDHPRVCGEKYMTPFDDELDQGSPPRMRGKDLADCPASVPPGITTAYAGKRHKAA